MGVSTGVGPVSYYSHVGGGSASRQRPRTPAPRASHAVAPIKAPSPAAQAKAAEARALQSRFDEIQGLNRLDFSDAQPPMARPPLPIDPGPFLAARMKAARSETSFFRFAARRDALRQAHVLAEQDCQAAASEAVEAMYRHQAQLDAWWASMRAGEPEAVLGALAAAFEDNEARAAAVGVDATTVSLIVVVPPISEIPDRRPSTTASGNLSLKRLTKTETNRIYKALVAGHVLLTVREAFAVAPVLTDARVVAVRPGNHISAEPLPVLAAGFTRTAVESVDWHRADPVDALEACSHDLLLAEKGASRELQTLDLTDDPELAAALHTFAVEDSSESPASDAQSRKGPVL